MSGREVRLPFGERPDGRLVAVAEAERGLDCGLVCPGCGAPLIARKGPVLRHHFAHAADAVCAGAVESMVHKLAKEAIAAQSVLRLPEAMVAVEGSRKLFTEAKRAVVRKVEIEAQIGPWRADALIFADGRSIAVEIVVSHPCSDEKVAGYRSLGVDCFEIDLSAFRREDVTREEVASAVAQSARRHWLVNAAADAERERVEIHLREKRREQERSRAAEQERWAKAQMAQSRPSVAALRTYGPIGSRAEQVAAPAAEIAVGMADPVTAGLLNGWRTHMGGRR